MGGREMVMCGALHEYNNFMFLNLLVSLSKSSILIVFFLQTLSRLSRLLLAIPFLFFKKKKEGGEPVKSCIQGRDI
jgi:hypothetical protein